MDDPDISRRALLKTGAATFGGLTALSITGPSQAFALPGEEVIPWLDQPPPDPFPTDGNILKWETLDSWRIPAHEFFFVSHYGPPDNLDEGSWRVNIKGLVARPQLLTIPDLKARMHREVDFTLECSGNTSFDNFIGGIGNARWGGTPLAPLLEEAGLLENASEVVFWGADSGTVTIRDNVGILSAGKTGTVEPDTEGGLDLTITEQFARSMSISEALGRDNLLCYEMNGETLPLEHGFPVRLIAPGWYGVANVKWLAAIEVMDRRYAGRFMARDYVNIREQEQDGQTRWTFTTVGRVRLKSAPAKVTRRHGRYGVMGAAWGAPIAAVEVQIDDGPWNATRLQTDDESMKADASHEAALDRRSRGYTWKFWRFDWGRPTPGEHRIRSRAFDVHGNMQPAPDDPFLASKRTYWESNGQITRRVLIQ
jgi:DMSO/TMAO reductase YedYZ molybdopterin-dependent catalytic subunit